MTSMAEDVSSNGRAKAAASSKKKKRPAAPSPTAKSSSRGARAQAITPATEVDNADAIESERALGRWFAVVLPAGTALLAIAVGSIASIGPGILVLAAGALLGAIALLWSSLRTLAGDAALPEELEVIDGIPLREDPLQARKKELLRALKDLAHDHAVGKIDDEDYEDLDARYREQAKAVMREIDVAGTPARVRAEKLAREHLAKVGLDARRRAEVAAVVAEEEDAEDEDDNGPEEDAENTVAEERAEQDEEAEAEAERRSEAPVIVATRPRIGERQTCPRCGTSNEGDATFCKKCGASLSAPSAEERDAAENAS
jgi:ribosomal protein L40E